MSDALPGGVTLKAKFNDSREGKIAHCGSTFRSCPSSPFQGALGHENEYDKSKLGCPSSVSSDPSVIDIANVEELPVVTEEATTTTTTTTEKEDPTTTVRSSTRDAVFSQSVNCRV